MYSFAAWGRDFHEIQGGERDPAMEPYGIPVCIRSCRCRVFFMNGMYLLGIPDPEDVQGVVAEYPGIPDEKKESTDRETVWWKDRGP